MRLSPHVPLLLGILSLGTATYTASHQADETTLEKQLDVFECRCGASEFLTLPHANITTSEEALKCSEYKLIDARGTAEPQGISTMFHIMISNILANTTGGVSLPVQYPAGPDQNTTSGESFVSEVIHEGLHRCPGQEYALFGYSQGATLMVKVLNRLDRDAIKMVKSVILVGNPYRLPGKMSNVNEKGLKDHSQSVGMFTAAASRQNSSASNIIPQLSDQLDKSGKVLDYCLAGDGVCSYNPACPCQLPAGHLSYGLTETVQSSAFEHVVSRLGGSAS